MHTEGAIVNIVLYELGTSRSSRCRWTLLEAELEFESIDDRSLLHSKALEALQPLGKLPVAVIDGEPLFESSAICAFVADRAPRADLIAKPGTWGRALHDQWVSFGLAEMEAWLWSNGINTYVLPEAERITACFEQNVMMFRRGAAVLDDYLTTHDYLVEDRFTVTDIIVGWTLNWGRRGGHTEGLPAVASYIERLLSREHCPFAR